VLCRVRIILLLLASRLLVGQLTVDATGPHRSPDFGTTGGSGGGIGRKLPLRLSIELQGTPFNGTNGKSVIEFVLTNIGKENILVPVSPDGADVEWSDSFRKLSIYITSDKKHEVMLKAGGNPRSPFVSLYGVDVAHGTVTVLSSGNSIRVRAEVALPQAPVEKAAVQVFVAHGMMDDFKVKEENGKRLMNSSEVGNAASTEYTWDSLLKQ
jgi:hypothetical protein